jgi:DNA-binding XRE family transcriptional regulator
MKTCGKCGGEGRIQPIQRYEAKKELMGGMQVVLMDVVRQLICDKCGAVLRTDIPDVPGLIAAVCVARAKENLKLKGEEIRFLRKTAGWTAAKLAQELNTADETVSRWENGAMIIGDPNERILRWKICRALEQKAPGIIWNDNELLSLKITPFKTRPLVMAFHRPVVKRREQWRERDEQKAAVHALEGFFHLLGGNNTAVVFLQDHIDG